MRSLTVYHTQMPIQATNQTRRSAFTLVELLVVVAVVGLLIGIILPALGGARAAAQATGCVSNLRQLGLGLGQFLNDNDGALPQVRVDSAGNIVDRPEGDNIGTLFGGKKGLLPFFGIDQIGAERRPLNPYLDIGPTPSDDSPESDDFELEIFRSPVDKGTQDAFTESLGIPTDSTYELLGTSYTLNDHALDDDPAQELYETLIPKRGGRMPRVANTTKTWMCASHPIYNWDGGTSRNQQWYGSGIKANILFVDGHSEITAPVADGVTQTTPDYTFLPDPTWLEQFGVEPE